MAIILLDVPSYVGVSVSVAFCLVSLFMLIYVRYSDVIARSFQLIRNLAGTVTSSLGPSCSSTSGTVTSSASCSSTSGTGTSSLGSNRVTPSLSLTTYRASRVSILKVNSRGQLHNFTKTSPLAILKEIVFKQHTKEVKRCCIIVT